MSVLSFQCLFSRYDFILCLRCKVAQRTSPLRRGVLSECAPTSGGADKLTSSSTLFTYFIYIHSPRHSSLASNLIHLVHTPCSCPCPKPTSLLNAQQPTEQCLHRLTPVDPRLPPDRT